MSLCGLHRLACLALIGAASHACVTGAEPDNVDELLGIGQAIFDTYAPPAVKEKFTAPTREQWDAFVARLEKTRATGTFADLAAFEPEVRAAVVALRTLPDYQPYADWLDARLDEVLVAKQATAVAEKIAPPAPAPAPPVASPTPPPAVIAPAPVPLGPSTLAAAVPLYDLWLTRVQSHPRPSRADQFLPALKTIFAAAGLPAELAWIAETESSFNPRAESPVGARGLFQLMPVTAKAQGLSLWPLDERTHPEKSARAAAALLRRLHATFDSWPLALAAYNAGEGRVRRALKAQNAKTFAQIADVLPSETRLYVPKVLATVAVREGIDPATLTAPK